MKNIVVLYGEEDFLVNLSIEKILTSNPDGQVVKYDLTETNISFLIEDALMISLFGEKKIIIGYNAEFLSGSTKKDTVNHNIDRLSKYIEHANPDTILILTVITDKLDKRKTIVKSLMDKATVKEYLKLKENDMIEYAKEIFDKHKYLVSYKVLSILINRVGLNLYLLNSECEKLMLYKMNDKRIDEHDIEEMIVKYNYDNIFDLTNAVIKRDISTSLLLYQELMKRNEEPIKIIFNLANQFRLIFQVKRLKMKGFSEMQIAGELKAHPYSVKLAGEVKLNERDVLRYIEALAELDEGIKTGKVNKEVGLELFFLKL